MESQRLGSEARAGVLSLMQHCLSRPPYLPSQQTRVAIAPPVSRFFHSIGSEVICFLLTHSKKHREQSPPHLLGPIQSFFGELLKLLFHEEASVTTDCPQSQDKRVSDSLYLLSVFPWTELPKAQLGCLLRSP